MSSEAVIAEQQRQLSALAELSLAMATDLQAASLATCDVAGKARLADAFCKVSRCVRMAIALSMRLSREARLAPARPKRAVSDLDRELDRELDEDLDDELDDEDDDEDFEGLERENLYDRLPAGDVPTQIATIARTLALAARVFPAPVAAAYRARCEALASEVAAKPPPIAHPPDGGTVVRLDRLRAPPQSRGPPGAS
jgi:hypothetical protein